MTALYVCFVLFAINAVLYWIVCKVKQVGLLVHHLCQGLLRTWLSLCETVKSYFPFNVSGCSICRGIVFLVTPFVFWFIPWYSLSMYLGKCLSLGGTAVKVLCHLWTVQVVDEDMIFPKTLWHLGFFASKMMTFRLKCPCMYPKCTMLISFACIVCCFIDYSDIEVVLLFSFLPGFLSSAGKSEANQRKYVDDICVKFNKVSLSSLVAGGTDYGNILFPHLLYHL